MLFFIAGLVGVLAFLAIPYRILQAHKSGDAEIGDYAFILFLGLVVFGVIKFLLTGA